MKRTTLLLILVAVSGVLVGGSGFRNGNAGMVRRVQAHDGCTQATLQGSYLFTVRLDNRSDAMDSTLPSVVAGVRTFDGAGNLSQVATDSRGGDITRLISATGAYTLDSNCIGTMTFGGGVRNWDIFVAEDGREGVGVRTDDGTIAAQTFKKRSKLEE